MRLIVVLLLFVGCADRPLPEHCQTGLDCLETELCVFNWDDGINPNGVWGINRTPANFCAPQCRSDAECESGWCARAADATTKDLTDPSWFACRW